MQATINEKEEWEAKATDLEDVCESLRLVNTCVSNLLSIANLLQCDLYRLQRNLASERDEVSQYEQRLLETQDELRQEREKVNQL